VVAGAVEGVTPTIRGDSAVAEEAAIAEGRRLFYVAVTRASEELTISSSTTADLGDANARGVRYEKSTIRRSGERHTVRTIASRYLAELGPAAPRAIRGEEWLMQR